MDPLHLLATRATLVRSLMPGLELWELRQMGRWLVTEAADPSWVWQCKGRDWFEDGTAHLRDCLQAWALQPLLSKAFGVSDERRILLDSTPLVVYIRLSSAIRPMACADTTSVRVSYKYVFTSKRKSVKKNLVKLLSTNLPYKYLITH